jgi:hypothetical protein
MIHEAFNGTETETGYNKIDNKTEVYHSRRKETNVQGLKVGDAPYIEESINIYNTC